MKNLFGKIRAYLREFGNLTPIAYAAGIASVAQQAEALRSIGGFAPRPVASPDQIGPNRERSLPGAG